MKLHIESVKSFTLIENKFIDEYMPSADGEFVKLYLYLLRCAGSGTEVSVSSMADFSTIRKRIYGGRFYTGKDCICCAFPTRRMEASAISACFPRRTKKKRMLNHP